MLLLTKFYIKTYPKGKEHIPENLSRFQEFSIIEKEFNGKSFCEFSITKQKLGWESNTEFRDTLYGVVSISWTNLEQTKLNIVIKNTTNGSTEVDIVDSDGNLID